MHNDYPSYQLIEKDYLRACDYIEPCNSNRNVYSHRVYELFVRACIEIESVLSKYMKDKNVEAKGYKYTAKDFSQLFRESAYLIHCGSIEVKMLRWKESEWFSPFEPWSQGGICEWFDSYNKVKHDRSDLFETANLYNLTVAIGALFLLHHEINGWEFFQPFTRNKSYGGQSNESHTERQVSGCAFILRIPKSKINT